MSRLLVVLCVVLSVAAACTPAQTTTSSDDESARRRREVAVFPSRAFVRTSLSFSKENIAELRKRLPQTDSVSVEFRKLSGDVLLLYSAVGLELSCDDFENLVKSSADFVSQATDAVIQCGENSREVRILDL